MDVGAIRLFHISDLHFGMEDAAALEWLRQCVETERPDAVAITGDLTMRARRSEYRAAADWIAGLRTPVTLEVGNHDLPYFNLIERFTRPYRRYRGIRRQVQSEFVLQKHGLAIVSLKTTARVQPRWPWVEGWIMPGALRTTLSAIDTLPQGTRVIVAAHHPLPERGPGGRLLTRGGSQAMSALARRGVLAVISGHVHDPFDVVAETSEGPLRMIGAGTLSLRTRTTPPSFNEITITGSVVHVVSRNPADVASADIPVDHVPEDAAPPARQRR